MATSTVIPGDITTLKGDVSKAKEDISSINGKVSTDRKSTRLNSSHQPQSRMPSSA